MLTKLQARFLRSLKYLAGTKEQRLSYRPSAKMSRPS
jgi:hypothetical protein